MALAAAIVFAVIGILAFVLAGGKLTGLPAWLENRAAQRADAARALQLKLQADEAERRGREAADRDEQNARRDQAATQMREDPVPPITATLAHYVERVRMPRSNAANAANEVVTARTRQYVDELGQLPESLRKPGTTRYVVLAAVPLFVIGSLVAAVLDYKTFFGIGSGASLAVLLSLLTVLIMTVSSVLIGLGMGWHKGLAGADWSRFRRGVVARIGVVVAVVGLGAMIWIAPSRSAITHEADVQNRSNQLQYWKNVNPQDAEAQANAKTAQVALDKAKSDKGLAAAVDRVSVGAITLLEIPLTEGMLFGIQVLVCYRARERRDEARRAHQVTIDALDQVDSRFRAEMLEVLAAHGHGFEPLEEALRRYRYADEIWRGMLHPPSATAPDTADPGPDPAPSETGESVTESGETVPPPPDTGPQGVHHLDGLDEMGVPQQSPERDR